MVGRKVKQKGKFKVISELDYKIIILENGENLSEDETKRLNNLREQKALLCSREFNIQKTVKVPLNFGSSKHCSFSEPEESNDEPRNDDKSEERITVPPESAKEPYRKQAREEKESLQDNFRKDITEKKNQLSPEERKEKKLQSDRKYKMKVKLRKAKKDEDDDFCVNKFREILEKKEEKMCKLRKLNETTKLNIDRLEVQLSVTNDMIEEKDLDINKLKEKYRTLHKIHKTCNFLKQV
eukprot:GFUD01009750.1.p1 GENE.GFUD01009750.1~~GFUD01009750.1.p1  ORF type:complete len:239 (+),score=77.83 GFUD01009750.1:132-848(+)